MLNNSYLHCNSLSEIGQVYHKNVLLLWMQNFGLSFFPRTEYGGVIPNTVYFSINIFLFMFSTGNCLVQTYFKKVFLSICFLRWKKSLVIFSCTINNVYLSLIIFRVKWNIKLYFCLILHSMLCFPWYLIALCTLQHGSVINCLNSILVLSSSFYRRVISVCQWNR